MLPSTHISDTALWQRVCEAFMTGVFHAFGSRVSALSGIATMAGMGQDLDGELLSLLQDEVEHLTDILEASRSLPRASGVVEDEGPSQVTTILPRVIRLMELNLDARGLDLEYEGPEEGANTEVGTTVLTHSLATLLACLGWRAALDGTPTVSVSLSVDERTIRVAGVVTGGASEEVGRLQPGRWETDAVPPGSVVAAGLAAIESTVVGHGGSLDLLGTAEIGLPSEFSLNLPALGAEDSEEAS